MAKIRVDHKILLNTSNELENKTKAVKSKLQNSSHSIESMIQSSWQGEDAKLFSNEVKRLLSYDSRFIKWMDWNTVISKNLKSSAFAYTKAQVNAVSRSLKIKKD